MKADLVLGAQWGDEGKGKITDVLAEKADLIVRFQGGNNAGHTIIVGGETYKLHHLPSGLVRGKKAVIGNGCVVDPDILLQEIEGLVARGFKPDLVVSDRAHVITPVHRALDGAEETARGKTAVGTTRRGIGPAYADKISRIGLRVGDLVRPLRLREKVEALADLRNRVLAAYGATERFEAGRLFDQLRGAGDRLAPYIGDSVAIVQDAYADGQQVLLEGAQGALLDVDFGTWPYVTSSNTTAGGACTGSGLPPSAIGRVFGVVKAYTTRVGAGPLPTELDLAKGVGNHLAQKGREFGTTTGRARRCGWLDLVVVRHAVGLSGIDRVALTKLDVLDGLDRLQVAVAYDIDGTETQRFPSDPEDFGKARPVYEEMPGWPRLSTVKGPAKRLDDLPAAAREYIGAIEETLGIPYALIGTGPARDETLLLSAL